MVKNKTTRAVTKKKIIKPLRNKKPTKSKTPKKWILRLYVAGQTPKCLIAFENLKKICEDYLQDIYKIEIIDLLKKPQLARNDQILAIPTLVKKNPTPLRKIIGDLSNVENVLVGLDVKVRPEKKSSKK